MKFKKSLLVFLAGLLILPTLFFATNVFAQDNALVRTSNEMSSTTTSTPSSSIQLAQATGWQSYIPTGSFASGNFETLVQRVINILLALAGAVAVIYVIIGGYQYTTASGNAEQAAAARSTILNALIGLLVIFAAFAIVNFVVIRFLR